MNLALFDFDGTITTRDTFTDFLHLAVPPWRLAVGKALLAPLIVGYKLGIVPATVVRTAVVRVGLSGLPEAQVRQQAQDFSRAVLPGLIRPIALQRIQWHQTQGDTVVVVSASLDVYLSPWCRQLGLELICSELETRAGALTGRYREGDCHGRHKARRILARYNLAQFPVVYAYGDTHEDEAMLSIAHKKFYRWQELG